MGLGAPEEVWKQTCDWGTNHVYAIIMQQGIHNQYQILRH